MVIVRYHPALPTQAAETSLSLACGAEALSRHLSLAALGDAFVCPFPLSCCLSDPLTSANPFLSLHDQMISYRMI